MKVLAISKKPRPYVLKDYRGEQDPPTFTIRSATKSEYHAVCIKHPIDLAVKSASLDEKGKPKLDFERGNAADLSQQIYARNLAFVKLGCSGWENVPDELGEALQFSEEAIECLHDDVISELANVINGTITEEDSKNSDTQSSPENGSETTGAGETAISVKENTSTAKETASQ